MPVSIPINNLETLSSTRVTGRETIPAVQYEGTGAYTYQVAMSSMFYKDCIGTNQIKNGSITLEKLSVGFPTWTSSGTFSLSGNLEVGNRTSSPLYLSLGYDRAVAGNTSIFMYSDVGTIPDTSIVRSSGANGKLTISNTGTGGMDIVNTNGAPLSLKTNNTTRLFVADDGDIGIGTNSDSPNAKLNVTYSSSKDAVRITQTGSGNALVVEDSTNPDSSPFVIDNTGTVVTGHTSTLSVNTREATVTPKLQVIGTSASNSSILISRFNNDGTTTPRLFFSKSRSNVIGNYATVLDNDNLGEIIFGGANGVEVLEAVRILAEVEGTPSGDNMPSRLRFFTTSSGVDTAPTERMRITSSGNVGIGTTSPSTKLDVSGVIKCTSIQSSGDADIGQTTRTGTGVSTGDVNLQVGYNRTGSGASKILLYSTAGASATGYVTIEKNSGNNGNLTIADNGTGTFYLKKDNTAGTMRFQTGGANDRITILANGRVGIGTISPGTLLEVNGAVKASSYNSTSSLKYKTNITPLEKPLSIVKKLNSVRFNWRDTGKSDIGLIAEEVDKVLPEFVLKNDKNEPEAIDYSKLTAVLIGAINEIQNKINN